MALTRPEAQEQILGDLQTAIESLDLAVACLGEAYEQISEDEGDRLDAELFRPVRKAFGQAKRARDGFARQTGASTLPAEPDSPSPLTEGAQAYIEQAVEAAGAADSAISDLQDTMLPIEFGDPDLRAALAGIREQLAPVPTAARDFLRALGR